MQLSTPDRRDMRTAEREASACRVEHDRDPAEGELVGQSIEMAHDLWLKSLEQGYQLVAYPNPQIAAVDVRRV